MGLLATSRSFILHFFRFKRVNHKLIFVSNKSNEGGRAVTSMVVCEFCLVLMEKLFWSCVVPFVSPH
jgi:hypothetical protein